MAMAGENVPAEVYDNLVATVRKHIPAMHRYVRLRKRCWALTRCTSMTSTLRWSAI